MPVTTICAGCGEKVSDWKPLEVKIPQDSYTITMTGTGRVHSSKPFQLVRAPACPPCFLAATVLLSAGRHITLETLRDIKHTSALPADIDMKTERISS